MKKIWIACILFILSSGSTLAADTDAISQIKILLDQYSIRVKVLEAENAVLREEVRKAGIKIPLTTYSGAIQTGTATLSTGSISVPTLPVSIPANIDVSVASIEKNYGVAYAGFVKRIITDWDKVRDAYIMPKEAYIGGYELVDSGALDHVFVDVIYTGAYMGSGFYDAKILYQFDKTTYARKLIGFFEFNPATGFYITKTGKNIFPNVKRTWIPDPRPLTQIATPVSPVTTSTGTTALSNETVTYADIQAAYDAKRLLSVISLSNTWLANNPPTVEIFRIRYRAYFAVGKHAEALKEVDKIQAMMNGQLTSVVACDAYVIATYAKNTILAESYKTICNKK